MGQSAPVISAASGGAIDAVAMTTRQQSPLIVITSDNRIKSESPLIFVSGVVDLFIDCILFVKCELRERVERGR